MCQPDTEDDRWIPMKTPKLALKGEFNSENTYFSWIDFLRPRATIGLCGEGPRGRQGWWREFKDVDGQQDPESLFGWGFPSRSQQDVAIGRYCRIVALLRSHFPGSGLGRDRYVDDSGRPSRHRGQRRIA